jgi:hypothetical protein
MASDPRIEQIYKLFKLYKKEPIFLAISYGIASTNLASQKHAFDTFSTTSAYLQTPHGSQTSQKTYTQKNKRKKEKDTTATIVTHRPSRRFRRGGVLNGQCQRKLLF